MWSKYNEFAYYYLWETLFYFDDVFLLLPILSINWGLSLERHAEFNILKRRPVRSDLVP